MAEDTTEQRLTRLEKDFGGSMQQIAHSLSELESTQYEHGALIRQIGSDQRAQLREIREIKASLAATEERILAAFKDLVTVLTQKQGE